MDGSRTVPPEDQPTRVREIGWIVFNGLSGLDHNSHFFFADTPLIHTLDRMNSKTSRSKTTSPFLSTSPPILQRILVSEKARKSWSCRSRHCGSFEAWQSWMKLLQLGDFSALKQG
jgi:hypothetical protein